jgi:hypothetical protein
MSTSWWIAVVCSAGALSAQAVSDEVHRGLPGWLRFSGEYRARFEGPTGIGFREGRDDAYLLNRVRIAATVQPAPWLKLVAQGQDARVFWNDVVPNAPPYQASMDLRMAYIELGDIESRPLSLRAGRQELLFGEQRVIGPVNWSNTSRTFDALRATFRYGGWRVDAFAATVVVIRDDVFDRSTAGNNLHGVYASTDKLVPQATFQPYVLWRLAPRLTAESGERGNLDLKTVGLRWVGKLPAGFDYNLEMAGQTGGLASDSARAWGGHWLLGFTIARARWQPRLIAEYNYATGDDDPRDGRRNTFDPLYPTAHDKYGLTDQVGWRNIHHLRWAVEAKPQPKLTVIANLHASWLASPRDALYNSGGAAVARSPDGSAGRHVGKDVNVQAAYALSRNLQIAGGVGRLIPGEFLKKASPGHAYLFPFVMLNYGF